MNTHFHPDTDAAPVTAPEVASGPAGAKALGDEFLTLAEAADELELATETLRRRVRKGHLKVIPLGLGYRVSREELDRVKREGFPYATFVQSTKAAGGEKACKKSSKSKK